MLVMQSALQTSSNHKKPTVLLHLPHQSMIECAHSFSHGARCAFNLRMASAIFCIQLEIQPRCDMCFQLRLALCFHLHPVRQLCTQQAGQCSSIACRSMHLADKSCTSIVSDPLFCRPCINADWGLVAVQHSKRHRTEAPDMPSSSPEPDQAAAAPSASAHGFQQDLPPSGRQRHVNEDIDGHPERRHGRGPDRSADDGKQQQDGRQMNGRSRHHHGHRTDYREERRHHDGRESDFREDRHGGSHAAGGAAREQSNGYRYHHSDRSGHGRPDGHRHSDNSRSVRHERQRDDDPEDVGDGRHSHRHRH